jgi:hypothetical protein
MIQIVEPWHSVHSELLRADAYIRTGKSDFPPQFVSTKWNDEELSLSSKPAFKSYVSFHHYRETRNLNQRLIIYKTYLSLFDQTFFGKFCFFIGAMIVNSCNSSSVHVVLPWRSFFSTFPISISHFDLIWTGRRGHSWNPNSLIEVNFKSNSLYLKMNWNWAPKSWC